TLSLHDALPISSPADACRALASKLPEAGVSARSGGIAVWSDLDRVEALRTEYRQRFEAGVLAHLLATCWSPRARPAWTACSQPRDGKHRREAPQPAHARS